MYILDTTLCVLGSLVPIQSFVKTATKREMIATTCWTTGIKTKTF